jgi:AcrR family transcriptional regulator
LELPLDGVGVGLVGGEDVLVRNLGCGSVAHGVEAQLRKLQTRAFGREVRVGHSKKVRPPQIARRGDFRKGTSGIAQLVHSLVHFAAMTAPVDGRAARKAATRDAIADALLDLLTEGNLRPTAREIAARAGISLRSVYVHFDDLEDLFCVAAVRQFDRVAPLLTPVSVEGPLRERADGVVKHRLELYAQFGAVLRATDLQAPFSPTLQRLLANGQTAARKELERVFAVELGALTPSARRGTLGVIDALTTSSTCERLRDHHGLARAELEQALVDAIVAVLERPA